MKQRDEGSQWLERGVALAAALCCELHDQPTIAADILKATGITRERLIEIDTYSEDLKVLDENDVWRKK